MSLPIPATFPSNVSPDCKIKGLEPAPITTCTEPLYPIGNCIPWKPYESMHAVNPYPPMHERAQGHHFFSPGLPGGPGTPSAALSSLYYSHPTFQSLAAAGLILPGSEAFFKASSGSQRFPPPPPGLSPASYFPLPTPPGPLGIPRPEQMFRGLPELNHGSHVFFPNHSGINPLFTNPRKGASQLSHNNSHKSISGPRYNRPSLEGLAASEQAQLSFTRNCEESEVTNNVFSNNFEGDECRDSYTKGTLIKLANGALRRVEDLKTDDFVQSVEKHPKFRMITSTVQRIEENHTDRNARIELLIEKSKKQVVLEVKTSQPFFVLNQGWASCDPRKVFDRYNLHCKRLEVGDVCISLIRRPSSRIKEDIDNRSEHTRMNLSQDEEGPMPGLQITTEKNFSKKTGMKNWTLPGSPLSKGNPKDLISTKCHGPTS